MPLAPSVPKSVLSSEDDDGFLYIPADIYGEILGLCIGCDIEISGMGQLIPYKRGYKVTKLHVGVQFCTSTETDICDDWLSTLEYEVLQGKHGEGDLSWWWHSHVDMGVFWSPTDMAAINQMSKNGGRMISTVFNRAHDFRTSYSQGASKDGYYPKMFADELKTIIIPSESMETEIKEKVMRQVRTATKQDPYDYYDFMDKDTPPVPEKYGINGEKLTDKDIKENVIQSLVYYYAVTLQEANDMYDVYENRAGYPPTDADDVYEVHESFKLLFNNDQGV